MIKLNKPQGLVNGVLVLVVCACECVVEEALFEVAEVDEWGVEVDIVGESGDSRGKEGS